MKKLSLNKETLLSLDSKNAELVGGAYAGAAGGGLAGGTRFTNPCGSIICPSAIKGCPVSNATFCPTSMEGALGQGF